MTAAPGRTPRHVHLVGVGGAGMSAIGRVLLERGDPVSGSDLKPSDFSRGLEAKGMDVRYGHRPENIEGADLVVASSAVRDDNVELEAARAAGLPVLRRREYLGELTAGQRTIAVAGTHGKSTTTALIAWILDRAGFDPGFIVGGLVRDLGSNARAGSGKVFVIEADEYDRAFLGLNPSVAVITTVEHDHPDDYPTPEAFREAFEAFAARVQDMVYVCLDDPGAAGLATGSAPRATYGLDAGADWRAEDVRPNTPGGSDFLVLKGGEVLGLVRTRLPGAHNVRNTLAALAVANQLGVAFNQARADLIDFHGVGRRFEIVGEAAGVTVVDDYAHHPTEVRATLQAARERFPGRKLWVVFEPHTYSRTRAFLGRLVDAFEGADRVIVTEIFASREASDGTLSGSDVAAAIKHPAVSFAADYEAATEALLGELAPGSVVLILSAGEATQVGRRVLEGLAARETEASRREGMTNDG